MVPAPRPELGSRAASSPPRCLLGAGSRGESDTQAVASPAPATRVLEEVSPAHSRSPGSGEARPGLGRALWSLDRADSWEDSARSAQIAGGPGALGLWAKGSWRGQSGASPPLPLRVSRTCSRAESPPRCQAWPWPAVHTPAVPRPSAHSPVRPPTRSFNAHGASQRAKKARQGLLYPSFFEPPVRETRKRGKGLRRSDAVATRAEELSCGGWSSGGPSRLHSFVRSFHMLGPW